MSTNKEENTEEAFPLTWPNTKKRSNGTERSRFDTTLAIARDSLLNELRLLEARHIVLSTNIALRRDGLPYASQPEPLDRGVAVYFDYKNNKMCFACDRWDKVGDNIQAIRKTIESIRGIERWGTGDMVNEAFNGFLQIESPRTKNCWSVLQIPPTRSKQEIKDAFKKLCKGMHPDSGGTNEQFKLLVSSRDKAMIQTKDGDGRV